VNAVVLISARLPEVGGPALRRAGQSLVYLRLTPTRAVLFGTTALVVKIATSAPRLSTEAPAVAITWLTTLSFVVIGLTLLSSGLPRVNGWACLVVAWAIVPGDLNDPHFAQSGWSPLGFLLEPVYLPAAVALVLRYPRRRLRSRERVVVLLMLAATVVSRAGAMFTAGVVKDGFHRPDGFPTLALDPFWHDVVFVRAGRGATAALLVLTGVILMWRAASSIGLNRQSIAPLAVVTAICSFAAAFDQAYWAQLIPDTNAALARDLSAAMIPVALLADLLRRRTAGTIIAERVVAAARSGDSLELQSALRSALADPSLVVGLPEEPGPRPAEQPPAEQPAADRARAVVTDDAGRALIRVDYNPRAIGDEALLRSALEASRVGLENTRLNAELRANLAALTEANARIVTATLDERRRMERNLHDGAQQQFLAVAALLARADLVETVEARTIIGEARHQLRDALAELRRLAHGIHPAALAQGGLVPAVHTLREAAPFRVDLDVDEVTAATRPGAAVEAAAYFATAEALANAAKHASATRVRVGIRRRDGSLVVRVGDDGVGGARLAPGGGLVGLRDRLTALHGSLEVHSDPCPEHPDRHGSEVVARIPLDEEQAR
jgi:signal transduction histidine kinase